MKWWRTADSSNTSGATTAATHTDSNGASATTEVAGTPQVTVPPATVSAAAHESGPSSDSNQRHGIVIAIGNQKGGVGKTTNTVNIAAALGLRGYKCLIIDLDPSAGATKHFGVSPTAYQGSLELLSGGGSVASLAITEGMPEGVHLIPSRPQLSELDSMLSKFVDKMKLLARPMEEARRLYDFILLDTPPIAAATPTMAAYAIAEWFLLCAFAHPLSLGGLTEAFNDIADVRQYQNPDLTILGVVLSNVDVRAKNLRHRIESVIDESLPGRRFDTWISQAVVIPECSGKGITPFQLPRYDRIKVARQYMALVKEIEARVMDRPAFLKATEGSLRCA